MADMPGTTQEELDALTESISEALRDQVPDVGFVLLAVGPPELVDGEVSSEVVQPFACRSNAATLAMFASLVSKGLEFASYQESTPQIVVPGVEH